MWKIIVLCVVAFCGNVVSGCQKTEGGNANGNCCVFPFTYQGKQHTGCTDAGYDKFWCATTNHYDSDKKWGICKLGDIGCFATEGGNSDKPCHFPFTYRGEQMNSCIKTRHDKLWCATTDSYDRDGKWADCLPERSPCACKPCKNGGSCSNSGNSYTCTCKAGFIGKDCEVQDMCASVKPCKNGATCKNTGGSGGGYECQCAQGFTGTNCDQDVDECATKSPCQNGAPCMNTHGGYSCACPSMFTGKNCETDVNECATNNPCQNGAPCLNTHGGYSCACPSTFTGRHCETDVNECATIRPCRNGGHCINTQGSYQCRCNNGFSGRNCERGPVYRIFGMRKRRNDAANYCRSLRGRLATVRNNQQNDQLRNEAHRRGVDIFWIGLNDQGREGHWQWDGGDQSGYRRWDGPEPNGGRKENCVEYLRRNGNWNDKDCNVHRGFACEVPQ